MSMLTTRDRIVDAARTEFLVAGIGATRMDVIASRVGIARPNVYRYFSRKQHLVKAVILDEVAAVNAQRRAAIAIEGPVRELIVDSLTLGSELIRSEGFLSVALTRDTEQVTSVLVSQDDDLFASQLEYWRPILKHGRVRGEIRESLDDARVIRWFMAANMSFAISPELLPGDARTWIEDFVVPPVLSESATPTVR